MLIEFGFTLKARSQIEVASVSEAYKMAIEQCNYLKVALDGHMVLLEGTDVELLTNHRGSGFGLTTWRVVHKEEDQ